MTDVSAWDPVDDNNNAAPPAGWPEGMMPSGVNNSARAMMGAVRREHDRIVGQIGSTSGAITTSGTVSAAHLYSSNDIVAAGDIGGRNFNASGSVSTPTLGVSGVATVGALSMSSPLPIASGGTAAATQASAFANIATVAASIGANPGYMKFPNGLLMQWGQTAGLAGANTIGVTFPTAFSGFVTVQATLIGDMTGIGGATGVSLSGFTATSGKTTGSAIHWFAIGF